MHSVKTGFMNLGKAFCAVIGFGPYTGETYHHSLVDRYFQYGPIWKETYPEYTGKANSGKHIIFYKTKIMLSVIHKITIKILKNMYIIATAPN